ncbi:hypothetical protein BGZ60DRAFT_394878 [Tricladium varicosporioides]|nr:hypothetical protein BGZ60DRAFT_394878 [Hymenoscyphus varicosporioides]
MFRHFEATRARPWELATLRVTSYRPISLSNIEMACTVSSNLSSNNKDDEPLRPQTNRACAEIGTLVGGTSAHYQQTAPEPDETLSHEQRSASRARAVEASRTFQTAIGITEKEREMVRREGEIERLRAARRSSDQDLVVNSGRGHFSSATCASVRGARSC